MLLAIPVTSAGPWTAIVDPGTDSDPKMESWMTPRRQPVPPSHELLFVMSICNGRL
jgi:hypothetical protein